MNMLNSSWGVARLALPLLALAATAWSSAAAAADYQFQIVGQPAQTAGGTAIKVRLTRTADGPVTDAHVFYQSSQPLNAKAWSGAGPRISMQADGQGNYTVVIHGSLAEGDPLHFVAEIPGHSAIASAPKGAVEATPAETVQWSVRYHKT